MGSLALLVELERNQGLDSTCQSMRHSHPHEESHLNLTCQCITDRLGTGKGNDDLFPRIIPCDKALSICVVVINLKYGEKILVA